MAFTTAADNAGVAGLIGAGTWIGAHTASPGTASNEIVYANSGTRAQSTFPAPANGASTGSQVSLNIPAGTSVQAYSLWSAQTAGTLLGTWAMGTNETFGNAGIMQFTPTISMM